MNDGLGEIIRREHGRVVATLTRLTGSIDRAEDACAEATIEALRRWPESGIPSRPGAWLTTVARRKAIDAIRSDTNRMRREEAVARRLDGEIEMERHTIRDDQLRLIFTCCHPALEVDAQLALSLRLLCGLTTAEIAGGLLETEAAVGKRITRAKAKIAANRIAYRIPPDEELPQRLDAVLTAVAMVFSTGHHAPIGDELVRVDLMDEAIRLAELLCDLMPDEPECSGLLALLVSTNARRSSRLDHDGALVVLGAADRRLWDHDAIARAVELVHAALRSGRPGPFQLQAAISCLHSVAPDLARTDWSQIIQLYEALDHLAPSPVVRVNRAIAVAERDGAAAGLRALDGVAPAWHRTHVARAEMLRRAARFDEAAAEYRHAITATANIVERTYLQGRLDSLTAEAAGQP